MLSWAGRGGARGYRDTVEGDADPVPEVRLEGMSNRQDREVFTRALSWGGPGPVSARLGLRGREPGAADAG